MIDDSAVTSKLRINREIRESAISETEAVNNARELLFSARVSVSAIPLNAFSADQRKTAAIQIRKASEALHKLRGMIGQLPYPLSCPGINLSSAEIELIKSLPKDKAQKFLLSLLNKQME